MSYNEAAHVNQSETPEGTEVTALRSARVYTGQGVAAVQQKVRLSPETLSHSWLRSAFSNSKLIASVLSHLVVHHDLCELLPA